MNFIRKVYRCSGVCIRSVENPRADTFHAQLVVYELFILPVQLFPLFLSHSALEWFGKPIKFGISLFSFIIRDRRTFSPLLSRWNPSFASHAYFSFHPFAIQAFLSTCVLCSEVAFPHVSGLKHQVNSNATQFLCLRILISLIFVIG